MGRQQIWISQCQNYTDGIPKGFSLLKLLSFLPQWEMKSIEYKLVKLDLSNFQENHFSTIKQRLWNYNGLRRSVTKCTWLHENKNLVQKISTTEWSTVIFPWRQNSTNHPHLPLWILNSDSHTCVRTHWRWEGGLNQFNKSTTAVWRLSRIYGCPLNAADSR